MPLNLGITNYGSLTFKTLQSYFIAFFLLHMQVHLHYHLQAATRGVLCKKLFLEISQNSQENTCAKGSFLIKRLFRDSLLKTRLWHRCFPVNIVKFLRTPFLQNTSGRPLLIIDSIIFSSNSVAFRFSISLNDLHLLSISSIGMSYLTTAS